MPDITMCHGENCRMKKTCYRYRAEPDKWQSYFVDAPIKDSGCEHYWPMLKFSGYA